MSRVAMPDPRGPEWMPLPAEVRQRALDSKWLRMNGFIDERWGLMILVYETPGIGLVRAMVEKHGAHKARKLLQKYIDKTPKVVVYEEEDGDSEDIDPGGVPEAQAAG